MENEESSGRGKGREDTKLTNYFLDSDGANHSSGSEVVAKSKVKMVDVDVVNGWEGFSFLSAD